MRTTVKTIRVALLASVLGAGSIALAADAPATCARDPGGKAMMQHMEKMGHCMDRLSKSKDQAERRQLMDEHMKEMHEGMGHMRTDKAGKGCQMEMMDTMANHMRRHREVLQEPGG